MLSCVVSSFQTTFVSLCDQWCTTMEIIHIQTHKIKQHSCYTLAYLWVVWTLKCFDCGAGEDNILWKFVSLYTRSIELVDFIKILGLFWNISGSVDKWRSRNKQNKAYANNSFMLFNLFFCWWERIGGIMLYLYKESNISATKTDLF